MPASLYRLAGKPHHAEIPAVYPSQDGVAEASSNVAEQQVPVATPAPVVEAIPIEMVKESVAVIDQPAPQPVEPEPATSKAAWDSSWTKTQLLQVANEMGLSLSITSTKADIIAALESAK